MSSQASSQSASDRRGLGPSAVPARLLLERLLQLGEGCVLEDGGNLATPARDTLEAPRVRSSRSRGRAAAEQHVGSWSLHGRAAFLQLEPVMCTSTP